MEVIPPEPVLSVPAHQLEPFHLSTCPTEGLIEHTSLRSSMELLLKLSFSTGIVVCWVPQLSVILRVLVASLKETDVLHSFVVLPSFSEVKYLPSRSAVIEPQEPFWLSVSTPVPVLKLIEVAHSFVAFASASLTPSPLAEMVIVWVLELKLTEA